MGGDGTGQDRAESGDGWVVCRGQLARPGNREGALHVGGRPSPSEGCACNNGSLHVCVPTHVL